MHSATQRHRDFTNMTTMPDAVSSTDRPRRALPARWCSNKTGRVAVRTAHIDTTVGSCNSSLQISAGRCISFNPSHKLYSRAVGGVGSELLQFDSINRDRVLCSLRNPFFCAGINAMWSPHDVSAKVLPVKHGSICAVAHGIACAFFFCG